MLASKSTGTSIPAAGANAEAPRTAVLLWAEASGGRDKEVFAVSTEPVTSKELTSHSALPAFSKGQPIISINFNDVAKGAQWPPAIAVHFHMKGEVRKETKPEKMRQHPRTWENRHTQNAREKNSNVGKK